MDSETHSSQQSVSGFSDQAETTQPGLARELFDMLRQNKKWWLAPIIISLLVMAGIVVLGGSAAAPLIYTLF